MKQCLLAGLVVFGFETAAYAEPPPAPSASTAAAPSASAVQPATAASPAAPPPAGSQPGAAAPPPPGYVPPPQYPPPGYTPPYPYGPYAPYAPPPAPRTLPYESGQPVPPGYHVESGMRRGPVIAGSVVLGVPYALGLSVASEGNFPNGSAWLVIPGVGPWFTLAARKNCDPNSTDYCADDAVRTLLIFDALMQTAGAAMLIVGIAIPKTQLVRNDVAQVEIVPLADRDRLGLAAVGRF